MEESIVIERSGLEEVSTESHFHGACQIIITTCGTVRVMTECEEIFVPEHHIVMIPCGVGHTVSSNNRRVSAVTILCPCPLERIEVYQSGGYVRGILDYVSNRCLGTVDRGTSPEMYDFILSFVRVIPFMCMKLSMPLTVNLVPKQDRIRPVLDYIGLHCTENLKFSVLAGIFGYSERNLSRLFSKAGVRFTHCLNTHRVTRAMEMMAEGNMPLREIAYSAGFSTPGEFSRVFRQITGHKPTDFLWKNSEKALYLH